MKMAPGGASTDEKEAMAASRTQCSDDEQQAESDGSPQLVCLMNDDQFEIIAFANQRCNAQHSLTFDEYQFAPLSNSFSLNTKQLKDLLDEAYAYKNPKDRVGKSKVFLDLLSEAESAERADEDLATRHRRTRASESNVAGGSLQNISQAVESDTHGGARRRPKQYRGPGSSVSSRQREGGSLPCNVNAGWTSDLHKEGERRDLTVMSTADAAGFPGPSGTQVLRDTQHPSKSSDAPFTIDHVLTADLPESNTLPFDEDVVDGKIMNRGGFKAARPSTDERVAQVMGSNIYYEPGAGPSHADDSHQLYRTSACLEVGDEFVEGAHMNGMEMTEGYSSVPCDRASEYSMHRRFCKVDSRFDDGAAKSGCNKKNNKRKNADKNVALSRKSEEMPGYRGNLDLDAVLNFIEDDGKMKTMSLKKQLTKQKMQEKKQKDIQKASSLEELSQRNIEDLTESCETDRWADQVLIRSESQNDVSTRSPEPVDVPIDDQDDSNDSEFQMVRKKHRRRRGADSAGKRVRRRGTNQRSPRRKSTSSVPPSERSDESDLDSVHSLPAHGGHASDSDCDTNGPPPTPPDECKLRTEDFPCLPAKPDVTKHEFTKNEIVAKNDKVTVKPEVKSPVAKPEPAKPAVKAEAPKPAPKQDFKPSYARSEGYRSYIVRNDYYKQAARQDVAKPFVKQEVPRMSFTKHEQPKPPARYDTFRVTPIAATAKPMVTMPTFEPIPVLEAFAKPAFKPPAFEAPPTRTESPRADTKPKTRSKSVGPNTRPPVILLDDRRSQDNTPCELTFGFEVNMQLLTLSEKEKNAQTTETMPKPSQADHVNPVPKKESERPSRFPQRALRNVRQDYTPQPATPVQQPPANLPSLMANPVLKPSTTPAQPSAAKPNVDQQHKDVAGTQPTETQGPKAAMQPAVQIAAPVAAAQPEVAEQAEATAVPPAGKTEPVAVPRRRQHLHRPGVDYSRPDAPLPYYILSDYFKKPTTSEKTAKPSTDADKIDPIKSDPPSAASTSSSAPTDASAQRPTQPKEQPECATCAGGNSSANSHVERRTSDVMTSTEDLETVMASQQSAERAVIPPVAENPAETVEEEERKDCMKDELPEAEGADEAAAREGDSEGSCDSEGEEYESDSEDDRVRRQNPYYPYANRNHQEIAKFNEDLWLAAINDPDTVWYSEKK